MLVALDDGDCHSSPAGRDSPSSSSSSRHEAAAASVAAAAASSSSASLHRTTTELDDLLDELLGQADSCARTLRAFPDQRRTSPGSRIGQACSQAARRRVPEPSVRNDSLSALRPLTPPASVAQPHHQPLHARLQIDIEVDQRTGSARIDSWSPVSCDSAAAYPSYGQSLHCIALYMASLAT